MDGEDETVREVEVDNTGGTSTRRESVRASHSVSGRTLMKQVVWFIIDFIAILLVLRIILQLLGANVDNSFVNFIYDISGFFAAPFFGMFRYTPSYGISYFEFGSLVAVVIYLLVGWGASALLSLGERD
ncbi:MAG: hypothetical protein ABI397_00100 [Candidatus Saccharimonas sp.]